MVKQLIAALVVVSYFLISGCSAVPAPVPASPNQLNNNLSLENWIDDTAIPYLTKELGESPRFKGKSFLFVNMDKDNIEPEIDDFTIQLREEIIDGLLTKRGIGLIWRPSTKQWEHHTSIKNVQCNRPVKEDYYIGIDAFISTFNGKLNIKIRALDIAEKSWVTGFGISWQGTFSSMQKEALQKKNPDNYLLGLRPLPFNEYQADLLAAYLSKNLSCLFADMELDEIIVDIKQENPYRIRYFNNAFNLVSNYLARYKEVTVTDDPSKANITVLVEVHKVYKNLFQVWVSARYKKNKQYVPGKETAAYVLLPLKEIVIQKDTIQKKQSKKISVKPASIIKSSSLYLGDFDICFYYYKDNFESKIYSILKRYPNITGIQRLYNKCNDVSSCVCYELSVDSKRYRKMEELIKWLQGSLNGSGAYRYNLKPISDKSIRIFFTSGFD